MCSQLVQFTLVRKGYDHHHCHNKPQTGNETGVLMTSYPEEMGWEFGRFWKRFSWVPTIVLRSWVPTMMLRGWGPTMMLRSWGPTTILRSWGPTKELRIWNRIMQADNWVSAIGAENGVLCHRIEFSTFAVNFFRLPISEDELRSKTPRDVPNVGGRVSIVWYERLLRIVPLSSCRRTEVRN